MSHASLGKRLRLERLAEVLRRRDWLGLLFEILVVTLGVLLAFQIDQWGDRRKQAREERQFLERLYAEYQRGIAELDTVDQFSRTLQEEIRGGMAARGNAALLEALSRRQASNSCGFGRIRDATFNDTGFEELISSGRINLITDPSLRSEVRDLAAEQAASARQVLYSRELMFGQLRHVDPYYLFDMDAAGRPRCRTDWPALVRDQQAVNAVIRGHRVHGFVLDGRQRVRARMQALIGRLACKLGKPECKR
jgi:hypothetical protein